MFGFNPYQQRGFNQMQGFNPLAAMMQVPVRNPSVYLRKTVTLVQGGNDAFIEGNIKTNANKSTGQAFVLREVIIWFPRYDSDIPDHEQIVQLTAKSVSAQLTPDDKDLIFEHAEIIELLTSGVLMQTRPTRIYVEEIIYAETLYVNFDTDGTGATNTAYVQLKYEEAMVTDFNKIQRAFM